MPHPILSINNLKKQYHTGNTTITALNNISLAMEEQEIVGLLGVNGAGKTTLSSIVASLHPPTNGDVLWRGNSIYDDIDTYRQHIGFCPQKANLNKNLTIEQNLRFAGRYYGMEESAIQARMNELIEHYQLHKYRHEKPDILSGGYVHRVLIARALMHTPKLLILDEPTVGLDPHIRHKLWDNIKELKASGVSILLTTHYLDEADVLSDRICVLDKGMIKLIDTPANLKAWYEESNLEKIFIQLMEEETEESDEE